MDSKFMIFDFDKNKMDNEYDNIMFMAVSIQSILRYPRFITDRILEGFYPYELKLVQEQAQSFLEEEKRLIGLAKEQGIVLTKDVYFSVSYANSSLLTLLMFFNDFHDKLHDKIDILSRLKCSRLYNEIIILKEQWLNEMCEYIETDK